MLFIVVLVYVVMNILVTRMCSVVKSTGFARDFYERLYEKNFLHFRTFPKISGNLP